MKSLGPCGLGAIHGAELLGPKTMLPLQAPEVSDPRIVHFWPASEAALLPTGLQT